MTEVCLRYYLALEPDGYSNDCSQAAIHNLSGIIYNICTLPLTTMYPYMLRFK